MFCLMSIYLLDNLWMTSVADCLLSFSFKDNVEGLMGVLVTV